MTRKTGETARTKTIRFMVRTGRMTTAQAARHFHVSDVWVRTITGDRMTRDEARTFGFTGESHTLRPAVDVYMRAHSRASEV